MTTALTQYQRTARMRKRKQLMKQAYKNNGIELATDIAIDAKMLKAFELIAAERAALNTEHLLFIAMKDFLTAAEYESYLSKVGIADISNHKFNLAGAKLDALNLWGLHELGYPNSKLAELTPEEEQEAIEKVRNRQSATPEERRVLDLAASIFQKCDEMESALK